MITVQNHVFCLTGEGWTCLLYVDRYGQLEQLHLGAPVAAEDAAAFLVRPGLGWGASVLLDDGDSGSCLDALPLAWSGSGRGDYRESPLDVGRAVDLRYKSHAIHKGSVPMDCTLPQARDVDETLELVLAQEGLEAHLYFSVCGTALLRRTVLVNTGGAPLTVGKCMSALWDLPGDLEMTTFDGSWIAEARKHTAPVQDARLVNESVTGFSSHRHNPGFLLSEKGANEEWGRVYGFNLLYSGNHYAGVQRSFQGLTRVVQGISPDHFQWELAPGEKFETPEAVVVFSSEGFGGMSRRMHRFVLDHVIPPYWRGRERPVLYNDWEGCMFDFTHAKLLSLAREAKTAGCELFVLDDGWFGARSSDRAGLGDYAVNKKKLPKGLAGLAADVNALGLQFGLWMEPESVNMDSDLYRAHPDWALTDEHPPVLGRHQLLLDLTKPQVRDYIVENVCAILDGVNIAYVKWDMNRHSVALGAKAHQYILGLCDVLSRVFGPRPHILLESCASGGNRFDLGMLTFGPQIWCSDDTDPIERLTIQGNLSYLYPQSTFGAHVSATPHAQTLRNTPLSTRGNVAFFGCLGYELDWKHLLPLEKREIREQVAFYKEHRRLFQFGDFYRLENGWQVTDRETAIAGVFRRQLPAAPGYEQLLLRGLSPEKRYRLTARRQDLRVGQFGNLVKHVAPVDLNPNGALLRAADRRITLPDGHLGFVASGAALMAGVTLLPLFRGTGYDKNQRTLLDNGSELYLVREEHTAPRRPLPALPPSKE